MLIESQGLIHHLLVLAGGKAHALVGQEVEAVEFNMGICEHFHEVGLGGVVGNTPYEHLQGFVGPAVVDHLVALGGPVLRPVALLALVVRVLTLLGVLITPGVVAESLDLLHIHVFF